MDTQDSSGILQPKVLHPVSCDGAWQGLGERSKGWNLDGDVVQNEGCGKEPMFLLHLTETIL